MHPSRHGSQRGLTIPIHSRCLRVGRGVDVRATVLSASRRCSCLGAKLPPQRRGSPPKSDQHPRVKVRGPGIEAWLGRSRADAPQALAHDSHRMHILQQPTLSSRRVTHSTKAAVQESVAEPWARSGPRGPHVYTHAHTHTMYIYIYI